MVGKRIGEKIGLNQDELANHGVCSFGAFCVCYLNLRKEDKLRRKKNEGGIYKLYFETPAAPSPTS